MSSSQLQSPRHSEPLPPLALRNPTRIWRALVGPFAVFLAFVLLYEMATNKAFEWPIVREYLFNYNIRLGLWRTVQLSVLTMFFGIFLALLVAQMRMSRFRSWRALAAVYVWFFRAVPALVLLIFIYNIGLLWPRLHLSVPFIGAVVDANTQDYIQPLTAAIIAFSLNEGAYGSEIVRASILAVPRGQIEAAHALGMTHWQAYRRVTLPQAFRIAVPPLTNDFVHIIKGTSLVAMISIPDLLYSAQLIYAQTFEIIPLLMVVSFWYVVLVTIVTLMQLLLERRLSRRSARVRIENRR